MDSRTVTSLYIDKNLLKKARKFCADNGIRSVSELTEKIFRILLVEREDLLIDLLRREKET